MSTNPHDADPPAGLDPEPPELIARLRELQAEVTRREAAPEPVVSAPTTVAGWSDHADDQAARWGRIIGRHASRQQRAWQALATLAETHCAHVPTLDSQDPAAEEFAELAAHLELAP